MRKILLSLFAFVLGIGANAEERVYATYGNAQSIMTYEVGNTTVKSVEYKTITFSIEDNKDNGTAIEVYFKGDNKGKVNSVARESVLKVQDEEEEPNYLYTVKLYQATESQFNLPFVLVKWNDAATGSITPFGKGKYFTIRVDKDAIGTLEADGTIFDAAGKGYNLPYLSIDLGPSKISTAINSVSTEGADAPAYNLAGQRVSDSVKGIVIKGGKKFIAK